MSEYKVYLVPGFFGFKTLGRVNYFHRVAETLEPMLRSRGLDAKVKTCETEPTGSIPRRAGKLARYVRQTGGLDAKELHFVGHSTGGLDARVLLSPQVHGAREGLEEQIGAKTRSLITLATPHHGTPLASFFTTVQGRYLLELLARLASSKGGRFAVVVLARTLAVAARMDDAVGRKNTLLDYLSAAVFRKLTINRDDPVWAFVRDVARDQGVILQLTPESLNLFNALARDREGVAYCSVATAAPPPPFSYEMDQLLTPERALLAAVFVAFHTINRWRHGQYPYPTPEEQTAQTLDHDIPFEVRDHTNDGIVPTLSQVHGRLLKAVVADHLDVVGQYHRPDEPLSDWLPSGAPFGRREFEPLWQTIADEIVRASALSGDG